MAAEVVVFVVYLFLKSACREAFLPSIFKGPILNEESFVKVRRVVGNVRRPVCNETLISDLLAKGVLVMCFFRPGTAKYGPSTGRL